MNTQTLAHTLQQSGLRLTPQRIAICELLANSKEHPSARQIYELLKPRFPSLSLATVYNTLEVLTSLGVVHALGPAGDGQIHYDADTSPHVNLACTRCHQIVDLESQHVQALEAEVSAHSGFKLIGANVMYYGLCPQCQQEENAA